MHGTVVGTYGGEACLRDFVAVSPKEVQDAYVRYGVSQFQGPRAKSTCPENTLLYLARTCSTHSSSASPP